MPVWWFASDLRANYTAALFQSAELKMLVKRSETPVLLFSVVYILAFGAISAVRLNYEFVIYCLVIVLFFTLILIAQRNVGFSQVVLWGLAIWGFLHMSGGNVFLGGRRLYDIVLLPIFPRHDVLRYDHFVHTWGFGVATLAAYHLLRPHLRESLDGWKTLPALVVLMGMGLGALNEIIELFVSLVVPESGVGGYYNTAFDLVFNTVGAVLAVGWIAVQRARQGVDVPKV